MFSLDLPEILIALLTIGWICLAIHHYRYSHRH